MNSDEIFKSYTQMRTSGVDAKSVLKTLRPSIDALPKANRDSLALQMRQWERNHQLNVPLPEGSTLPVDMPPVDATVNPTWIECPECGKKNRRQEIFCYSCGQLLEPAVNRTVETRQFADATEQLFTDDYFGEDSVLIFVVRDTEERFELRPQIRTHELVLGRSAEGVAMTPDIDLSLARASEMGVSRLHLAVRYDRASSAIQVYDLGSANGSYINGQKLLPREIRILRNSDELRLAKMVLRVYFMHPGEAI